MAEWTHPRRAAKETISYLSQVEPVIDKFAQDDHSYGGGDEEEDEDVGREQMMDNILEELKHQTASIMEDRQGSVVAEKIVRRLTPLQLRVMLSRCGGYMLSLANNRYSSHVLQTLLSVAGSVIEAEVSGDDAYRGEEPSTAAAGDTQEVGLMQDVVISLVSELSGTWAELLADVSGSHVGRGFLQVLGGLPILTEKRGRQSRHSHSIGTAVGPGGRGHSSSAGGAGHPSSAPEGKGKGHTAVDPEALEKWSTPFKYPVPRSFEAALGGVTSELAALPAGELQALACGTFGCPTMVMLLRVHGNLAVDPASGRLPALEQGSDAMKLVMKTLEWENEERSVQVVYAISGENTASHFLEAVLWLSPRGFFQELYHRCFESKLLEFCEHGVSNFLIQAALQRADDKALAETMVAALGQNASDLLKSRRAGVLWRAAQACVRLSLSAKTQTKLLEDIARAVQAGHTGAPPPPPSTGDDNAVMADAKGGDGGVTSPSVDAFRAAREWVPALLSPRLPGEGGLDRLFLNVPGARIVQNALLFEPPVAAPVLKAVAALPEAVLAAVARDNMGSRCLLDPILEAAAAGKGGGGRGKNRPAEDARRSILRAFRGHLVAMACDRVAWHILLKCFRGVDMKEKRVMAEELAGAGEQAHSRMSGYPSGRSVLTECMVERFSRSPHEWEDAFKNRDNRSKMLTEILAVESAAKSGKGGKGQGGKKEGKGESATNKRGGVTLAPSPFSAQEVADGGDEGDAEGGGNGKDKRRRQRGRGKRGKSSKGGDGAGEEGANAADQSGDALEAGRNATEGETPAETGGGGSETREHAAENGSGQGEKSSRKVAKEVSVVGGTEPVPKKKKKRRRQEGQLEGGGVGGEDAAGEEAADLSFVTDAVKKSESAEGQAAVASGKKDKKDKKDKKKNKKKPSESDSGSVERGADAAPREAAVEEAPATVVADSTATDSAAKKKKRRKVEAEAKAVAVDSVSERSAGGLAKQEAGDGGAGAEPKTAAGSEKGSEKKRKKTSSGGGFRLF